MTSSTIVEKIIAISPQQLQKRLSSGGVTLVDVRELSEYQQAHIPGAILKPSSTLSDSDIQQLLQWENLVLYCRSGRRSRQVAEKLVSLGKQCVFDLQGGIIAWQEANLPVE
ncbi:MAG: rhodanese-like domain-containing protein [Geminocystis sp.]|nr:rhodanese-like domain-containing protein [Geminocystis sp.]HIK38219.1 rhodanese-like domain-containing protein [Geminocystis sp. M7585_C2015_104]MCS7148643.1 rhodanese-like domain-containing protein [Geminocystis sp.]MCX8079559.1 rhodanese-like domain-containing protein [Geminocystis sp.]MDW8115057.1 rhodanese-like domain-containing protein [Geminocystis sp.]